MLRLTFSAAAILIAATATADVTVEVHKVDAKGVGASIGTLKLSESKHGLVIEPELTGLAPGTHGFHVHQNGNCGPQMKDGKPVPAGAAGDHYDPQGAKKHGAPWGEGHKGDMPPLYVDENGRSTLAFLAPRLTLKEVQGKAFVIHAGGDNFSDQPKPLGGGGDRVACAVVKAASSKK